MRPQVASRLPLFRSTSKPAEPIVPSWDWTKGPLTEEAPCFSRIALCKSSVDCCIAPALVSFSPTGLFRMTDDAHPPHQPDPDMEPETLAPLAKARRRRLSPSAPAPTPLAAAEGDTTLDPVAEAWSRLRPITLDPSLLADRRIITAERSHAAHGIFDVLRTKIVQALAERGWRRVGVTSPTRGCGRSFLAANLAITMSRYENHRTVLLDLDLRQSSLARLLGVPDPGSMGDFLRGLVPPEEFFRGVAPNPLRVGSSLAIGFNGKSEPFAAELFFEACTRDALARLDAALAPHVVLIDLPPVLAQDDVLTMKPHLDCVLMVAGGGMTTSRDLREASRRLGEDLPILGVVLNKAE